MGRFERKRMRRGKRRESEEILTGEGRSLLDGGVGHRWRWWFEDGVGANKGRGDRFLSFG